jgi:hypothetical protein
MTFRTSDYLGDEHPVSVYAAGDLHLAYLEQQDGEITARALVWPERRKVGRTYGDTTTLLTKLLELGYEKPENYDAIKGARLLKIPYRQGYIMPFLDACGCDYSDAGEFWIMGLNSKHKYMGKAQYQHGLSMEDANLIQVAA